jgi:hypothetical protein
LQQLQKIFALLKACSWWYQQTYEDGSYVVDATARAAWYAAHKKEAQRLLGTLGRNLLPYMPEYFGATVRGTEAPAPDLARDFTSPSKTSTPKR